MDVFLKNKAGESWLIKYKLYHIPFWFLYHFTWWTIATGDPFKAAASIFLTWFAIKFFFYVIFQALAVYFNLYFLIPRYLEKGKFIIYLTLLVITIFCAASLIVPGYYLSGLVCGKTLQALYGPGTYTFWSLFLANPLPSTIASMTLAMSIKLAKNWVQTKHRQQVLEKEKLETELKFLKYQFNPHFLFNSINSIFFLIHKNPDMASASLAKFSELLRYQLYECNDHLISLVKEITYLENFVELEKLRQNNNVSVSVQLDHHTATHWNIAPFILMTFVENAFKHVSKNSDQPNWINIKLTTDHQYLNFTVSNSTSTETFHDVINYGGIGLKNVQRRLDLMYAGSYELNINDNDDRFEVKFRLQRNEQVMHEDLQKIA